MRSSFIILIALVAALAIPPAVRAEGVRLRVDPSETPLRITAWLGDESGFVGNLRLSAEGGDVEQLIFLPSDLRRAGDTTLVGRQNITLAGDLALRADTPRDFQVRVAGLTEPGLYTGTLDLLIPNQPPETGLSIPIEVTARARPRLTPLTGTDQIQLQLVRCGWVGCWLARTFLPEQTFLDGLSLQFDNLTREAVEVRQVAMSLISAQTRYQISEQELTLPVGPQTLPADQIVTLPMTIDRELIPAGHYTGAIYLSLEGKDERISLPVDLKVRADPLLPLLVLLFGIVLGRLALYMQNHGQPQSEQMRAAYLLESRITSLPEADQAILQPMLAAAWEIVYRLESETAASEIKAIAARADLLGELRALEQALRGKEQHLKVKEVLAKIGQIRTLVGLKRDAEAQRLLEEVKDSLVALQTVMMGPGDQPEPALIQAAANAAAAQTAAGRASEASRVAPPGRQDWLRRLLAAIAGSSGAVRAEATFWLVRPLLYLVLMLTLLAIGFKSYYIDNGLTFGANPMADYLGLFLWGLSADVASRNLSSLASLGKSS